jgi:hypothetical protein
MQRPIRFQGNGFCIATGLSYFIHIYFIICALRSDLRELF